MIASSRLCTYLLHDARSRQLPRHIVKLSALTTNRIIRRHFQSAEDIRNVGIIAHIDAGKTTTTEHILYTCGVTKEVGRVDDGNTMMDFLPQERERGITISSAAIAFNWNGSTINLIDTPGHVDFTIEVERSVRVMDSAVVILDSVAGVQAQTRTVWKQAERQSLPAIVYINKMDRDGSSFTDSVKSLQQKLNVNPLPIQIPYFKNDNFHGVIDLISFQSLSWEDSNNSKTRNGLVSEPITEDHPQYSEAVEARERMFEGLADVDEEIMELYLKEGSLSIEQALDSIRRACISRSVVPILCGTSLKKKGTEPLLNAIKHFLPSPRDRGSCKALDKKKGKELMVKLDSDELVAFAFKVIHDVSRGTLVFVRVYSGSIMHRKPLYNTSKGQKDTPNQLLKIAADNLIQTDRIDAGNIGCIVGLKHTSTGDTLVLGNSGIKTYTLDGLTVPSSVYVVAIEPERSSQQQDLTKALDILCLEDPSLQYEICEEGGNILVRGLGELHVEIVCDKLRRQFKIDVNLGEAYVAYRETIAASTPIEKRYVMDRSLGGNRMFAAITISLQQNDKMDSTNVNIDKALDKRLTHQERYVLADAFNAASVSGSQGYPLVGMSICICDFEKDGDTSEGAIRACAAGLLGSVMKELGTVLLEPVMSIEVEVPEMYVGDVLSDLSVRRRATIGEMTSIADGFSSITGVVPFATMLGYATDIRSMTHGQGTFSLLYLEHQPVTYSDSVSHDADK